MGNNLYEKLIRLVDRQWELRGLAGYIKHDKSKRSEYEAYVEEFNKNDEIIEQIRKGCFITPLKLADIISEQEKKQYKLKIFRETNENAVGETYYTTRFIAGYLNEKSEYFDFNENPVVYQSLNGDRTEKYTNNSLSKEEYKKLYYSLIDENSFVISTSEDISFIPGLAPSLYLEGVNFTNLFVYGRTDDIISYDFQKMAKDYVKKYLEQIDAEEFFNSESKEEKEQ